MRLPAAALNFFYGRFGARASDGQGDAELASPLGQWTTGKQARELLAQELQGGGGGQEILSRCSRSQENQHVTKSSWIGFLLVVSQSSTASPEGPAPVELTHTPALGRQPARKLRTQLQLLLPLQGAAQGGGHAARLAGWQTGCQTGVGG